MWENIIVSIAGTIVTIMIIYSAVSLAVKNTVSESLLERNELDYEIDEYEREYM